jgi:hypothetical protein
VCAGRAGVKEGAKKSEERGEAGVAGPGKKPTSCVREEGGRAGGSEGERRRDGETERTRVRVGCAGK